jgi:hypothetical protein
LNISAVVVPICGSEPATSRCPSSPIQTETRRDNGSVVRLPGMGGAAPD